MEAHLEKIKTENSKTFIVRIFEDGRGFDDPYEWSCLVLLEDKIATIIGVDKPFKQEYRNLLRKKLLEIGAEKVQWERIKNKKSRYTRAFRL